jgi:hypothetical protein
MDFGLRSRTIPRTSSAPLYVLEEGETEAPPEVRKGFETIVAALETGHPMIEQHPEWAGPLPVWGDVKRNPERIRRTRRGRSPSRAPPTFRRKATGNHANLDPPPGLRVSSRVGDSLLQRRPQSAAPQDNHSCTTTGRALPARVRGGAVSGGANAPMVPVLALFRDPGVEVWDPPAGLFIMKPRSTHDRRTT